MAGRFVLSAADKAKIADIAKNSPAIKKVVRAVAADVLSRAPGAHIAEYTTDRFVNAIIVDATDQAINGTATKALGQTSAQLSGVNLADDARPFVSQAQWHWAFANDKDYALYAAHNSPTFSDLPTKKGGG